MTKICLVANNPHVCHIPDEYDLYVHFNWANNFALTPVHKNIMAMRYNKLTQQSGRIRWHDYCDYAKETIAIGIPSLIQKLDKKIEIIDTTQIPCPEGTQPFPTSGFAAIHYFLKKGYDVTVCGFDIEKAIYYKTIKKHPLDWEKEQIALMVEQGKIKRI